VLTKELQVTGDDCMVWLTLFTMLVNRGKYIATFSQHKSPYHCTCYMVCYG